MFIPKVGQRVRIKRPKGDPGDYYGLEDSSWAHLEASIRVVSFVNGVDVNVEHSPFYIPLDSVHPILLEDNV